MRIELLDLLRIHKIAHPSAIRSMVIADGTLEITVDGYRWWQQTPGGEDGTIKLMFEGLSEGAADVSLTEGFYDDEALEDFTVRRIRDVTPTGDARHEIYCSAPLGDPFAVYMALQDYLSRNGAYRQIKDFLNCGDSLRRFVELAREHSFLLGSGPDDICELIRAELNRQHVPHNVLTSISPPDERLVVRLGEGSFLCAAAWAEFEEGATA